MKQRNTGLHVGKYRKNRTFSSRLTETILPSALIFCALAGLLTTATGREPVVIGKPQPEMVTLALERFSCALGLFGFMADSPFSRAGSCSSRLKMLYC